MEQTYSNLKRPRPVSIGSLQIQLPRVKPVAEISLPRAMSYNHRPLSPGGRRVHNAGRASENTLTDPYYNQRHGSYASPRSSGGVIPISTQTFVNNPPPSSSRPEQRYDSYSGRPRRSSLVDTARGVTSSISSQLPSRGRPTVIQQDIGRPASPLKSARETKEYYITPASSQEPRTTASNTSTSTHKKLYSVDDGGARLVADVNIPAQLGSERHHKRRESVDRSGYNTRSAATAGIDRGRRQYHTNGTHNRARDKDIDDEGAYEYTDPAGMYRDTEPRWRETRGRRGSMDRGGATSRERPVSVLDPTFGTRLATKEIGPPPSTRGWDKIKDNIGRTRSVRDNPREVAQSPTRGRTYTDAGTYNDPYYVPPRTSSTDRRTTVHNYDTYEYEDRREPRRPERRHSVTRDSRLDPSVERRGFGIRPDYRTESQTRFMAHDARGSDESFERQKPYRDSGYAEPHRRDTAPDTVHTDTSRLEQERKDRELAQRLQDEERTRTRARGYSDSREYSREPRRREEERGYDRDYDRTRDREYERDRERERERARQLEVPTERDRDRHHHRRDTADRDYGSRKESSPKQSGEQLNSKPGLAQAATGGLAGAAAAFGLSGLLNKVSDKHKDRDDDRERERERPREDRKERTERSDRRNGDERNDRPERRDEDRERNRERRPGQAASDEPLYEREQVGDRHRDADRGLGFAFEAPEPPRSAPPTNTEWSQEQIHRQPEYQSQAANVERTQERQPTLDRNQDRVAQRDFGDRAAEVNKPVDTTQQAIDPDEDYRRRMEQVQRELGRTSGEQQRGGDYDSDRERRRREREQRQREREGYRNGGAGVAAAATGMDNFNDMPPHPSLRRSFDRDDQSTFTATTATESTAPTELKRKPSILDRPMGGNEPGVQIIDNSLSDKRENRVRIVDPPTEEEERKPKGILKKPTEKFPEDPNAVREGVAPLKDATKKGIPPGARWTKIDRRLVNPEALEAAHERFEERLDCVIVLRVLTKEEIQKLADKTREIRGKNHRSLYTATPLDDLSCMNGSQRFDDASQAANKSASNRAPQLQRHDSDTATPTSAERDADQERRGNKQDWEWERRGLTYHINKGLRDLLGHSLTRHADQRYEEERSERKGARRNRDRRERDEYEFSDSENEFKEKKPKMLEAPSSTAGASSTADFIRDNQRRYERDEQPQYMSGGLGRRDDQSSVGRY